MAKTSAQTKQPKNAGTGNGNSLLEEFFVDSLKDIYYAEKAIAKALPKMKKAATSEKLAAAFEEHLTVTKQQIERLEQVFETIDEKPKTKKCEAIEGLIKESESIIEDTDEGTLIRRLKIENDHQKI